MKNIIAKEVFLKHREVKKWLWWWEFGTDWYYVNSVWWYGNVESVVKYMSNQRKRYKTFHRNLPEQWKLFEVS